METGKEGEILESLAEITRHKDVELLEITLAKTIFEQFDSLGVSFFRVFREDSHIYSVITVSAQGVTLLHDKNAIEEAGAPFLSEFQEVNRTRIPLKLKREGCEIDIRPIVFSSAIIGYLVISQRPGNALDDNMISGFLAVYQNYHELLLEYQHDTLTGLLNRKAFEDRLYHLMELQIQGMPRDEPPGSKRRNPVPSWGFWLGIFDIDDFKKINDTYGHVYGDDVLILLADLMRKSFRPGDIKLRFGGEEFVVVIRASGKAEAVQAFERFRRNVEERSFGLCGTVTVSIGMTKIDPREAITNLIGRADQAMYHAKKTGKNRTFVYEDLVSQGIISTDINYGDVVLF